MAIPNLLDPTLERALPLSRGALYANSDRNAFGTRNVAAGLDNFDFRDLGWTV